MSLDEKDRERLRQSAVRERLETCERPGRGGGEAVRQVERERLEVVVTS